MTDVNNNEVSTQDKTTFLGDTQANVDELSGQIDGLSAAIEVNQATAAATQKMREETTEDRKKEHAAFKQTVEDQEPVIKVLKVALSKLEGFYGNLSGEKSTGAGGPSSLLL